MGDMLGGEQVRRKKGRPPVSNPKRNQVKIKMTDEQLANLKQICKDLGITQSKYIIAAIKYCYEHEIVLDENEKK